MVLPNAQSQASPTRGNQENSQYESFGDKSSKTRSVSGDSENQSFRGGRNDSTGRNDLLWAGGCTPGGTIKQLIAETLDELNESESKSEKLRRRLIQLTNLLESVESPKEKSEE